MAITILAWIMVIVFMALIMTKKLSPFTALVVVPLVFVLIGSFMGLYGDAIAKLYPKVANPGYWYQFKIVGDWTVTGLKTVAVTAFLLLFAIMYFSLMLNVGLFNPVTRAMLHFAKGDPLKILVATAIVSAAVSLNGDGTTTTLIVCTAFIPVYKKLGMKMMNLAVLLILMNTIMNLLPWGGPTARVMGVFGWENGGPILAALAPGMVVSVIYMLGVSVFMGIKERKRLGVQKLTDEEIDAMMAPASDEEIALRRPKLIWFNAILTVLIIVLLVRSVLPSVFLFMVGTVIALLVNYPNLKDQKQRIQDNAGDALQVVILIIGAGIFAGLFTNSGMATALADSLIKIIPTSLGHIWGLVTAVVSAPGTFFLSNDAFYYGVLPVFAKAGAVYGFTELELGVASLLGQAFHLLSPLVAFIYLLLNLTGLDMGEWQKQSAKWAVGIFVIFIGMAVITGALTIYR